MRGFDCAAAVTREQAPQLAQIGYEFFARYYRRTLVSKWAVSPDEARNLFDAGLWMLSIFQNTSDQPSYFNQSNAATDAHAALAKAAQMKQPLGTAIYFAVDCNPDEEEIAARVIPYFDLVARVVAGSDPVKGARYIVGVYGSGLVCRRVVSSGMAKCAWLANATGWRGTKGYEDWQVKQTSLPFTLPFGLEIDANTAFSPEHAGLWRP